MISVLTGFAVWYCRWRDRGYGCLLGCRGRITARTTDWAAQELRLFMFCHHGRRAFAARRTRRTGRRIRTRQRRLNGTQRQIGDERGLFGANGIADR